jgi:hypothetical protein
VLRLLTPDNKRKVDEYRQECLLHYQRMEQNNSSIAWESQKAETLKRIDENADILVMQSLENLKSFETYLVEKEKAARTMSAEEVKRLEEDLATASLSGLSN